MQTTRTDPPYVPLRQSGWPTRRAPRWALGAGAVAVWLVRQQRRAGRPGRGRGRRQHGEDGGRSQHRSEPVALQAGGPRRASSWFWPTA